MLERDSLRREALCRRDTLDGATPDLLVWFMTPHHVGTLDEIHGAQRALLRPRASIGTAAVSVIGGGTEIQDGPGLTALAAVLPEASITPVRLGLAETVDGRAKNITDDAHATKVTNRGKQNLLIFVTARLIDPSGKPLHSDLVRASAR